MTTSLGESFGAGLGPGTVLTALGSAVRAERAIARNHLKQHLSEPPYRDGLVEFLQVQANPSALFLDALSTIAAVGELPLFDCLSVLLDAEQVIVKKHATRVIARCFSSRCGELSPWFADPDIRYECCFSGDLATAELLWQWYRENQRAADIAFGLLLTPEILCGIADRDPAAATDLAAQFGYLESLNFEQACPLLERGFWCVPDGILPTDHVAFGVRSAEIEARLSTILLGRIGYSEAQILDPSSCVDVAALCNAVRSLDHQILEVNKFENRLQVRSLENVRRALCKHAPLSFCRKILISDQLREAVRLGVPELHQGQYLLEHAATLVTHDTDLRLERLMYLKSRWTQRPNVGVIVPSEWSFPVLKDSDAPELKYRIMSSKQWSRTRGFLDAPSPGALAAARLLQAVERDDLIDPLFAFERMCETLLCPCGTELQVTLSAQREHESLAWKQALRALGIPSPRRPEYRSMVEVSFPPSRSYLPQVLVPLLLQQLGLLVEAGDIALHQSFSGDLGTEVRDLLFAQQFINRPRVRPGALRLARLMSKGFAHLNHDAIPLDGVDHGGYRTELRSYRFGCGTSDEPLQRHYIDDIIETSLLIASKSSPSPNQRKVWDDYCQQVSVLAAQYPPIFTELLQCDWYESTGESRDEEFASQLPVVQAWKKIREWVKRESRELELRQAFSELRRSCAARTIPLLNFASETFGPHFAIARCGAPYLDPQPLLAR